MESVASSIASAMAALEDLATGSQAIRLDFDGYAIRMSSMLNSASQQLGNLELVKLDMDFEEGSHILPTLGE